MTVKGCLVDVYDTILSSDFDARMRAVIQYAGADPGTWSAEWLRTRADRDRGRLSYAASLAMALRAGGVDPRPELLADVLRFDAQQVRDRTLLYDDTVPFLTQLRSRGILIALVSNCGDTTRPLLQRLGVIELADAVVLSCEIGAMKPSPEIYFTALEDLGVAAADAVMIDDQPAFCAGAEAVGVHAIQIARGGPAGRPQLAQPSPDGQGFPLVRSLLDAVPLLCP